ncbi:MAG: HutD family protein [Hyphomicrobiales bacterium]
MRHLRPEDYRVMPWKNGGGVTTEIAIYPEGTGISGAGFIWRVSIADVAVDGPFSRFPGYDRHIMTIAGKGMRLEARDHGAIDLSRRFVPREFSGDWDVDGQLIDGPVRDFNLMVERERATGTLVVETLRERKRYAAGDDTLLLHVLEGDGVAEARIIAEGDTLILSPHKSVAVTPSSDELRLAVVRIAGR